jgi:hypothetical protein
MSRLESLQKAVTLYEHDLKMAETHKRPTKKIRFLINKLNQEIRAIENKRK